MMTADERTAAAPDPGWVRSACEYCLNSCGILAYHKDGKVIKIEGDPQNPHNYGRICGKGQAGFMFAYSPGRVTRPLRRTNPNKGAGEDPRWEPISWEEALDVVAGHLKRIGKKDPRLVYVTSFDYWGFGDLIVPWCLAYGTELRPFASGFYCGNNVHNIHFATEGALEANPDAVLTRYLLLFGSQYGAVVNYDVMAAARGVASKRPGGIKVVAIDPVGSYAAGKAEEWLPIRPGTDAALALSFINLLINEYNLYDQDFLKRRTNGPYLIGADGSYVRDAKTSKPLVWDASSGGSKTWDDKTIGDFALTGSFRVDGTECQPAFQKLKDHTCKYDPDKVAEITTLPAGTIRRVAKEFGEAACIGQTISINGKELPYRPASVAYYRGLSAHKHSMLSGLAVETLQVIIGGINLPGGLLGSGWEGIGVTASEDGLLRMVPAAGQHIWSYYPPRKVVKPQTPDLLQLFPVACYSRPFFIEGVLKPDVYKTPLIPEMLISIRTNLVKSSVPLGTIEQVLAKIPFMVTFAMELDETAEYADIIFPDLHYLERLSLSEADRWNVGGQKPWFFYGQKPVVKPPFEPPWDRLINPGEIFLEIAKRAGFLPEVYEAINRSWGLKEPYRLDTSRAYSYLEMSDRRIRSKLGGTYGLDWFMMDGLLVRDKPVEKMYDAAATSAGPRVHIYFEFMKAAGEEVASVTRELGIPWDTSDYQTLPDWKPCQCHTRKDEKFDLTLVNYKVPQLSFAFTNSNAFLRQIGHRTRADDLLINSETARRKGIRDGDKVCVETAYGRKATGTVHVSEFVHPEVVACQGSGGRFARESGLGRGKGINFNELISFETENIDYVTTAVDSHLPVTVYRAP